MFLLSAGAMPETSPPHSILRLGLLCQPFPVRGRIGAFCFSTSSGDRIGANVATPWSCGTWFVTEPAPGSPKEGIPSSAERGGTLSRSCSR